MIWERSFFASRNNVCCSRTNLRSNAIRASLEGSPRDGQSPYSCRKVREEAGRGQDCVWGEEELQEWRNDAVSLVRIRARCNKLMSLEEELTPLSWHF